MLNYTFREMPDMNGRGERILYPKATHTRKISLNELLRYTSESSGFKRGEIYGALSCLIDKMTEFMSLGYSVKLNGMGTFNIALGIADDKERESLDEGSVKRNAQSVKVKSVNFIADKQWTHELNLHTRLERDGKAQQLSHPATTVEERISAARNYLDANTIMSTRQYAALTGLSVSTAQRELVRLRKNPDSGITAKGKGTQKVYIMSK